MPDRKLHWENVYGTKAADSVSWYQLEPAQSLRLIDRLGLQAEAEIIDIGAGASALVDKLLERGFKNLTVLDVSQKALDVSRLRLGARANAVNWLVQDITKWACAEPAYDLWHDRAVFHFLTEPADRDAYLKTLAGAVKAGGHAILATFAHDGPERCSGLIVERYSPDKLIRTLAPAFTPIDVFADTHTTPGGSIQNFTWGLFKNTSA